MLQTTPFLLFDGNCAEAMTFYHKCLGGELTLTKLGDTPMKDMFPPEKWNKLINAHLKSGAIEISATDWMASPSFEPIQGNKFAIFVIGETYDELKAVFDKLAVGAEKERFQELHDMPFGTYGQFYDKYGVQWIFKGDKKEYVRQAIVNVSLVVRDYDEAIGFFTKKLHFILLEDKPVPEQHKRWVVIAPPGSKETRITLGRASTPEQEKHIGNQTGGRVFLSLNTDDFWRDYKEMMSLGIEFIREPKEESYGTVAVFKDLYGNLWDLIQYK